MLSLDLRPAKFSDMCGQDLVKKSLMHICKNPESSPKCILLCGTYGSGKTTAARIFAKALNCPNKQPDGDCCGQPDCPICGIDIQDSMFYSEYDSAMVGNVESIKQLRNQFYFGYSDGYKVIVLDETHLVSKQAQGALLKVFEEPEPNVFFVLCTTDPEKLLPTIVSRSLELRYSTVKKDEMLPYLQKILDKSKLNIPEEEIEKNLLAICDRSHGHMRNAMMLLDSMYLLQEDFKETVKSAESLYVKLFTLAFRYKIYVAKMGVDKVDQAINTLISQLTRFMIVDLKSDYETFVLNLIKNTFIDNINVDYAGLVIKNSFNIINIFNDEGIYKLFVDDTQFQIAMLVLINRLKNI
jgi:DNA polymerase-3 subunit gamma/tau